MKFRSTGPRAKSAKKSPNGFALVVTLSLMILLTVIAVGLLTLSGISLRSSSRESDQVQARANAKLALMLALGELQKSAGPDRAATATSPILAPQPAKPNLTGVWESWNYNPSASNLDYAGEKQRRFRAWLVSDRNPQKVADLNYATLPADSDSIVLAGARSYGLDATAAAGPQPFIKAGKVPLARNGTTTGAYAWHVSDESVKARINSYRDPSKNQTLAQKRALLAGHRPDPSVIKSDDGSPLTFLPGDSDRTAFDQAAASTGKLVSLAQAGLLAPASSSIARFRDHVTPYSLGIPVNVRDGGLKSDLSALFGFSPTALPSAFNNKKLYATTHGITGSSNSSDPNWSVLKSYHDIYQEPSLASPTPVYYKAPPEAITLTQTAPPTKFHPMPVIAKVEMLFSFVVRDPHSTWAPKFKAMDPQLTRAGHLLFAPIITIHNPYNVSLKFDKLDLDIKGLPMAFNFVVNGKPQCNTLVPLNELFVVPAVRAEKSWNVSISDWRGFTSDTPSPITMKPGQVLVCGPYLDGGIIFGDGGEASKKFFDIGNDLTGNAGAPAKCKPGFLGRQVSYDVDWLTLPEYNAGQSTDGNLGMLGLRPTDRFYIEYGVKPCSGNITDKMTVNARLTVGRATSEIGGLRFDYDASSLARSFPGISRYPDARSVPNTLLAEDLHEPLDTPLKSHAKVKSFALFSAYAHTTNGGVYDNSTRDKIANGQNLLQDGRYAGVPLLHHNPARTPTVVDLKTDLPGRFSHELNLQQLPGHVDDLLNIDTTTNRGYALTGNKTLRGVKSGSYLEIPTGPLQSLADFRRSNALTGPQLPNFVQPVSNSYSSPLIATDKVVQTGIVRYPLLDHSVLANHALYDRFYFSTIAQSGNVSADQAFTAFMKRESPLPAQCFEPYLPSGRTLDQAKAELFAGSRTTENAYLAAAQYQLVRGPFNVNSTDVQAWKAALAAMNRSTIQTLWAVTAAASEKPADGIPLLPMSLVNAGKSGGFSNPDATGIDNRLTNDFSGYRELTDPELDTLARRIVDQVRLRGPFLSLSEFVNRRIGPASPLTRTGALQAAIDESKLNDSFLAGFVTPVRATDVTDTKVYGYQNPDAATGNPAAGAPGWIMQGDLMRLLEPGATVRSDTFVIRVCGEAIARDGKVTARAYAEAVVQRIPEFINPADRPSVNVWDPSNSSASPENKTFGRRLDVVSFRWLAPSEI